MKTTSFVYIVLPELSYLRECYTCFTLLFVYAFKRMYYTYFIFTFIYSPSVWEHTCGGQRTIAGVISLLSCGFQELNPAHQVCPQVLSESSLPPWAQFSGWDLLGELCIFPLLSSPGLRLSSLSLTRFDDWVSGWKQLLWCIEFLGGWFLPGNTFSL